jgi:hypothetical protein
MPPTNANPGAGGARVHVISQIDAALTTRNQPAAQSDPAARSASTISVSDRVVDIANTVHAELVVCPHVISVLKTINAKYPSLPFGTFLTAMRLVELATREPRGNA